MRRDLRRAYARFAVLVALTTASASAQTLRPEVYVTDNSVFATALSEDGSTLYIGGDFT